MKKWIALAIVAILLIGGGIWYYQYRQSRFTATVNYDHVHDVQVLDISGAEDGAQDKVIATLTHSGQSVDLPKDGSYIASYKGDDGYKDDFVSITPTDPSVTIDPDYSDSKNTAVATSIAPEIEAAIVAKYPTTKKYFSIGSCQLMDKATWCMAPLHYTGPYGYNSDNLRILLHRINGSWQLATKPDIILTTVNYPDIPESVLSWANDFSL